MKRKLSIQEKRKRNNAYFKKWRKKNKEYHKFIMRTLARERKLGLHDLPEDL